MMFPGHQNFSYYLSGSTHVYSFHPSSSPHSDYTACMGNYGPCFCTVPQGGGSSKSSDGNSVGMGIGMNQNGGDLLTSITEEDSGTDTYRASLFYPWFCHLMTLTTRV